MPLVVAHFGEYLTFYTINSHVNLNYVALLTSVESIVVIQVVRVCASMVRSDALCRTVALENHIGCRKL